MPLTSRRPGQFQPSVASPLSISFPNLWLDVFWLHSPCESVQWTPPDHSQGDAASKQCPDLSLPASTPNSSLGVQPHWTLQGSGSSFLMDTTLSSSHFRATVPQIQQQIYKTWRTYRCLHKCRWSNASELSHFTLRLPLKHTHKSLFLLFVWLGIGK